MGKLLKMMLASLLVVSMLSGCTTAPETSSETVELTSAAQGYHGDVEVKVVMEGEVISSVEVTKHEETQGVGTNAIDTLPGLIVETQSVNVDTVSGATLSSNAIITAVSGALTNGGYDLSNYSSKNDTTATEDVVVDAEVVVVGTGLSGMTAAVQIAQRGAKVVLVEKMSFPGGNTATAKGNMTAIGTQEQLALGLEDSVESFVEDWKQQTELQPDESNGMYPKYDMIAARAEQSGEYVDWLVESGYNYQLVEGNGYEICEDRRFGNPDGKGSDMINHLIEMGEEYGVEIYCDMDVQEIIMKDGVAAGVIADHKGATATFNADAVVLATGGFASSKEISERFTPEIAPYVDYATTSPSSTGDGIILAENAGAALYEGDWYQGGTNADPINAKLNSAKYHGKHITVNAEGNRMSKEIGFYGEVYPNIIRDGQSGSFMVFDSGEDFTAYIDAINADTENADEYFKADTLEELAALAGIDTEALAETVASYNAGNDPFGKDEQYFVELTTAPYYAAKVYPKQSTSQGGPVVDETQNVMDTDGNQIPGLYACGELVFKPYFNKVVMPCVSFMLVATTAANTVDGVIKYLGK